MLSLLRLKLLLIVTLLEIHFRVELVAFNVEFVVFLPVILPSEILRLATWLSLFKGSTSIAKMSSATNFVLLTKRSDAFNLNKEPQLAIVTLFSSNDISLPSNETIPFSLLVPILPLIDILSASGSTIRLSS